MGAGRAGVDQTGVGQMVPNQRVFVVCIVGKMAQDVGMV